MNTEGVKSMIKNKKAKRLLAGVLGMVGCMSINGLTTFAATEKTKVVVETVSDGYQYHYVTTYTGPSDEIKKLGAPGIEKSSAVPAPVIKLTKAYTVIFSASASVDYKYNAMFCEVGAKAEVGLTEKFTNEINYTFQIDKNAPNGVYYLYVGCPRRRVEYTVEKCSKNQTDWKTIYTTTLTYVPKINYEYYTVRKG
jgi:hypothetical protein